MEGDAPLTAEDLRITDDRYGHAPAMLQCSDCGFIQSGSLPEVPLEDLYAALDDPEYAEGRHYRMKQMDVLLTGFLRHVAPANGRKLRLLDVGAGAGFLVEAARRRGVDAIGVEPSEALARDARAHDLPVFQGTLPHVEAPAGDFDIVTCVDVIEHVTDPVSLLRSMARCLQPNGLMIVTSPDVESLVASTLGRRWWHYRAAHVCFLPTSAMHLALAEAGLRPEGRGRQTWWFSLPYLASRAAGLVAGRRFSDLVDRLLRGSVAESITLPLNTFDSWVWRVRKGEGQSRG